MLPDDARDLALAEFPDGERAPRLGEQALPTLEPRCVLPEGLAEKLAPSAALPPGDLVDLTGEGCRDRDRYGALIRHGANVTQILIGTSHLTTLLAISRDADNACAALQRRTSSGRAKAEREAACVR